MNKLVSAVSLAACVVLGACQSTQRGASMAVRNPDPVTRIHTVIQSDPPEDLGMKDWRASTLAMLDTMNLASFCVDDDGYLLSFSPAFDPVEGVSLPPSNVPLRYVRFNEHGQLLGWEAYGADELLPAWSVKKTDNPPPLPPTYSCINNSCSSPSHCVVTHHQDPTGNELDVTCDCIAAP